MLKKRRIGTVVSTKLDKTVIVEVRTRYPHPLYSKVISRTKRYLVHDPKNTSIVGDKILIELTRPQSLNKCWILKKIYN
jgi:small subunit ribosomal protein S17